MSNINKHFFLAPGKNGRRPLRYPMDGSGHPVRLQRLMDMKLPAVDVENIKSKKTDDLVCNNELMKLLECFSKHDFDKEMCINQTTALNNCYSNHQLKWKEQKEKNLKKSKKNNR